MMQLERIFAGILALSMGLAASAEAQNLRNSTTPAEFPAASFTGKQYIDSNGCVFIRAGVDGSVTWVPRVTRDRKLVCGFKPTFANAEPTEAPAAKPTRQVVQIVPDEPVNQPVKVAAAPAPAPKPKPKPVVRSAPRTVVSKPKPRPMPVQLPKPIVTMPAQHAHATAQVKSNCSHMSAISQRYMAHPTAEVRCGPQAHRPHYALSAPTNTYAMPSYQDPSGKRVVASATPHAAPYHGQVVRQGEVGKHVRVVPRHVYEKRANTLDVVKPPKGYRSVWDDGRLNPHRAEQTFAGKHAMDSIWETQKNGVLRLRRGTTVDPAPQKTVRVMSSRNTPKATRTMTLGSNTFVQVAAYGDASNARSVAKRVRAMGMPVRVGHVSRYSGNYSLVLAGPFASHSAAQAALRKARAAGYSNAHIR